MANNRESPGSDGAGAAPDLSQKERVQPENLQPNDSKKDWEVENRRTLATIADYLQWGVAEARDKSELLANQVNKQAKVLKNLTVVFALFFTYLQIRQIYVGNSGSQQQNKFSAWEMVQNVQEKDTSAGLAIALKTLAKNCEPLSGLNLSDKYLPGIKLAFPKQDRTLGVLSQIGIRLFRVPTQSHCHEKNSEGKEHTQLDLRGIDFGKARLEEATFENTDLTGAIFQEAKLQKATFKGSVQDVGQTYLSLKVTNFQRANLTEATLRGVDLSDANLSEADLSRVKLEDVMFSGATLSGANFTGVKNLTLAQVQSAQDWEAAIYDEAFCQKIDPPTERPQSCTKEISEDAQTAF